MPDLSKTTVYRALEQLQKEGLIVQLGADRAPRAGRDRVWFEGTKKGADTFEEWLRNASEAVPMLDELHSKLLAARPENLPELIEQTWPQEQGCLARLGELERADPLPAGEWRRSWEGVTQVLVRNNQIAHLQTTVREIQRAREVMTRLRDDPHWPRLS